MKNMRLGICIDEYLESFIAFTKNNLRLFIVGITVAIFAFSFELFYFSFSIDNEFWLLTDVAKGWVRQGRWGMFIVNNIFPAPVIPFLPLFLSLIFSVMAFICFINLLKKQNNTGRYLSLVIFVSSPIFLFSSVFYSLIPGIGLGLLLSTISIYCLDKQSLWLKACGIILGAFVIGIYQVFIVFLATLLCLYMLSLIISKNENNCIYYIKKGFYFVLMLATSLALYYLINYLFMHVSGYTSDGYIEGFRKTISLSSIFEDVCNMIKISKRNYLGYRRIIGISLIWQGILSVFIAILICIKILTFTNKWSLRLLAFIIFVIILLLPFSSTLIINFPLRAMFSIPLVIAGLTLLAFPNGKKLQALMLILGVACVINYSYAINKLSFTKYLSWERDKLLAYDIINKIDDTLGKDYLPTKAIKIIVIGKVTYREEPYFYKKEVIGASFFTWDGGCPYRVSTILRILTGKLYEGGNSKHYQKYSPFFCAMPNYPNNGFVKTFGNIVLIKFSELNGIQAKRFGLKNRVIYHPLQDGIREVKRKTVKSEAYYSISNAKSNYHKNGHIELLNKSDKRGIHISITGSDPMILLHSKAISDKNSLLEIDIESDADDRIEIYYLLGVEDNYKGGQELHLTLKAGRNHFYLNIPNKFVNRLRIDPGTGKARHIVIHKIALYENDK